MSRRNIEPYLDREDFDVGTMFWAVAEKYEILQDDLVTVARVGKPRLYAPLREPNLLYSFAKLASKGKPAPRSICNWVNRYGLLKREREESQVSHEPERKEHPESRIINRAEGLFEDVEADPSSLHIGPNKLNQASVRAEEFAAEAMDANSALSLHADLYNKDYTKLWKRIRGARDGMAKGTSLERSRFNDNLINRYGEDLNRPPGAGNLPWMAEVELATFVSRKIDGVRLALSGSGYWNEQRSGYKPTPSWECPDLLSAIYLQFYLLITESLPVRRCANPVCEMPFVRKRKDKRFCTPSCRSGARRHQ